MDKKAEVIMQEAFFEATRKTDLIQALHIILRICHSPAAKGDVGKAADMAHIASGCASQIFRSISAYEKLPSKSRLEAIPKYLGEIDNQFVEILVLVLKPYGFKEKYNNRESITDAVADTYPHDVLDTIPDDIWTKALGELESASTETQPTRLGFMSPAGTS